MTAFPRSRFAALAWVLLLHGGLGWLLLQPRGLPLPDVLRTEVRLVTERPRPPEAAPIPRTPQGVPSSATPLVRAPVPEFEVIAPSPPVTASPSTDPPGPAAAVAPAPLNLNLPPPQARTRLPEIAEQLRHDPRSNTPMASAEQRMAEALGAKGWTVTDLGEGSKMVRGPFGECAIIRPSMVDGIAGHPHAGLLQGRSFPCGGIEKGSKVPTRPHERKR